MLTLELVRHFMGGPYTESAREFRVPGFVGRPPAIFREGIFPPLRANNVRAPTLRGFEGDDVHRVAVSAGEEVIARADRKTTTNPCCEKSGRAIRNRPQLCKQCRPLPGRESTRIQCYSLRRPLVERRTSSFALTPTAFCGWNNVIEILLA
jgi:hypothetical protein